MKKLFLFSAVIFLAVPLFAGGPGTTAANFLRIGTGAKAAGMGEAQVAVSDNVDSIYWNPAGLALVSNPEVSLMHLIYWQGMSYEYAAVALPIKKLGTFALGINYFSSGNIDKTGENLTGSDYTSLGSFSYTAFAGTFAYATKIVFEKIPLNIGAGLKIVGDKVEEDLVLGAGLDIGATAEIIKNGYVGLTFNNIGVNFAAASVPLPMQMKAGMGYVLKNLGKDHLLVFAADGVFPFDAAVKLNAGVEYGYQKTFFVRFGYKMNYALENITAGAGFRLNMDRTQYELNYSFSPGLDDIGTSHRISLLVRFGVAKRGDIPEQEEDKYSK